ncbi:hypothetical protein ACERII_16380 [Evansella sp. AB-rgal1]
MGIDELKQLMKDIKDRSEKDPNVDSKEILNMIQQRLSKNLPQ